MEFEQNARENASRDIISAWANNDPEGAGKWLATLPAGKSREQAVQSYVSQISHSNPELAAPWVDSITNEQQRWSQMEQIARNWMRNDSNAARTWLANSSLPDDRKQRLLKEKVEAE